MEGNSRLLDFCIFSMKESLRLLHAVSVITAGIKDSFKIREDRTDLSHGERFFSFKVN